jgi:hypothetical protein
VCHAAQRVRRSLSRESGLVTRSGYLSSERHPEWISVAVLAGLMSYGLMADWMVGPTGTIPAFMPPRRSLFVLRGGLCFVPRGGLCSWLRGGLCSCLRGGLCSCLREGLCFVPPKRSVFRASEEVFVRASEEVFVRASEEVCVSCLRGGLCFVPPRRSLFEHPGMPVFLSAGPVGSCPRYRATGAASGFSAGPVGSCCAPACHSVRLLLQAGAEGCGARTPPCRWS